MMNKLTYHREGDYLIIGVSVGVKGYRKTLNLLKIQGFSWSVSVKKMQRKILSIQCFEPISALFLSQFCYVLACFAEYRLSAKKMQIFWAMKFRHCWNEVL